MLYVLSVLRKVKFDVVFADACGDSEVFRYIGTNFTGCRVSSFPISVCSGRTLGSYDFYLDPGFLDGDIIVSLIDLIRYHYKDTVSYGIIGSRLYGCLFLDRVSYIRGFSGDLCYDSIRLIAQYLAKNVTSFTISCYYDRIIPIFMYDRDLCFGQFEIFCDLHNFIHDFFSCVKLRFLKSFSTL